MGDYQARNFPDPVQPPAPEKPPFCYPRRHRFSSAPPSVPAHAIAGATTGIAIALIWSMFLTVFDPPGGGSFLGYVSSKPITWAIGFVAMIVAWSIPFCLIGGTIGACIGVMRNKN